MGPSPLLEVYRSLYRISPIKFGLNRLTLKLWPILSGEIAIKARISSKKFWAELNLKDRIQFMMYVRGTHEPNTEKVFLRLFENAATFVDIGGNIGYFSLLAAATKPSMQIHAFEPMPENVGRFRRNIGLNGFTNIRLESLAVSSSVGTAELICPDREHESGWNAIGVKPGSEAQTIQVKTTTLDQVAEERGLTHVDVIKIDVEGHELSVLRGAKKTLEAQGKRALVIEINEACLSAQGTSGTQINDYLCNLGYEPHEIRRNGALVHVVSPDPKSREGNYCYLKFR